VRYKAPCTLHALRAILCLFACSGAKEGQAQQHAERGQAFRNGNFLRQVRCSAVVTKKKRKRRKEKDS